MQPGDLGAANLIDTLRFVLTASFTNTGMLIGKIDFSNRKEGSEPCKVLLAGITTRDSTTKGIKQALDFLKVGCKDVKERAVIARKRVTKGFAATLSSEDSRSTIYNRIISTISLEVQALIQLYNINQKNKRLIIRDNSQPNVQDGFYIKYVGQSCPLMWKLQTAQAITEVKIGSAIINNISAFHQVQYSHMNFLSDFDLESQGRRYASVSSVMGVKEYDVVKASGVTLLPSELFARVISDLIFCPRGTTRKVVLHQSKTYIRSFARVAVYEWMDQAVTQQTEEEEKKKKTASMEGRSGVEQGKEDDSASVLRSKEVLADDIGESMEQTSNSVLQSKEVLDEYNFGSGKGLSVSNMKTINWARQTVSTMTDTSKADSHNSRIVKKT